MLSVTGVTCSFSFRWTLYFYQMYFYLHFYLYLCHLNKHSECRKDRWKIKVAWMPLNPVIEPLNVHNLQLFQCWKIEEKANICSDVWHLKGTFILLKYIHFNWVLKYSKPWKVKSKFCQPGLTFKSLETCFAYFHFLFFSVPLFKEDWKRFIVMETKVEWIKVLFLGELCTGCGLYRQTD